MKNAKLPDMKKNSATRMVWFRLNASTLASRAAGRPEYGFNFMHLVTEYRDAFKQLEPDVRRPFQAFMSSTRRFIKMYCTTSAYGFKLQLSSILEYDGRTLAEHKDSEVLAFAELVTVVDKLAACPPLKPLIPQGQDAHSQVVRVLVQVFKGKMEKLSYEIPGDYRDEVWGILTRRPT